MRDDSATRKNYFVVIRLLLIVITYGCQEEICYECMPTGEYIWATKKISKCDKEAQAYDAMKFHESMGYDCIKISKSTSNSVTYPEMEYQKNKVDSCGCNK